MTDFRPDCIINLHVETRGKPAKLAWSCSLSHAKQGQIVLACRFLGFVTREEAELKSLLFGLRQASRLLQEKVELRSTFSLEEILNEQGRTRRKLVPELRPFREESVRLWGSFRHSRHGRLEGAEALVLQKEAENAYRRGRN